MLPLSGHLHGARHWCLTQLQPLGCNIRPWEPAVEHGTGEPGWGTGVCWVPMGGECEGQGKRPPSAPRSCILCRGQELSCWGGGIPGHLGEAWGGIFELGPERLEQGRREQAHLSPPLSNPQPSSRFFPGSVALQTWDLPSQLGAEERSAQLKALLKDYFEKEPVTQGAEPACKGDEEEVDEDDLSDLKVRAAGREFGFLGLGASLPRLLWLLCRAGLDRSLYIAWLSSSSSKAASSCPDQRWTLAAWTHAQIQLLGPLSAQGMGHLGAHALLSAGRQATLAVWHSQPVPHMQAGAGGCCRGAGLFEQQGVGETPRKGDSVKERVDEHWAGRI